MYAHARPQGSVLSAGHVRPSGCPWLGKPPILHQLVGHDLASRLQEGWLLRDEHQTKFLASAKIKCVFVCACRRTVHCNSVSQSCAAEFTVILSYTVHMHTYTFIYIQIRTLHIVFPSLQQPPVNKYFHILTYTCIYQQIRSHTI